MRLPFWPTVWRNRFPLSPPGHTAAREVNPQIQEIWDRITNHPFLHTGKEPEHGQLQLLSLLIKEDLRNRFDRGETPAVAEYLEVFPQLVGAESRVLSLLYEEFCLLEEHGRGPSLDSFCRRYSAWKDSLEAQIHYHRHISRLAGRTPPPTRFPSAGETFEEFRLIAQIGQGGSSRVFVASDLSLGNKRVVLKVSIDRGDEPKTQGALDHPHIVPVNSVVFDLDRGLRGLSMPFRPGVSLEEILRRVRPQERPSRAIVLWEALVEGTRTGFPSIGDFEFQTLASRGPTSDGWRGFPADGSYAQGVAWIGFILARTLQYAHSMNTFHRDVKPGNVLLTLQHGPQLLDFNLARSPHSAQQAESAMLGGTLPYMAPEQIEAFLDPKLWGEVKEKADLYSLGLVLRQLLSGAAPEVPDETLPSTRALRQLLDSRLRLETSVRSLNPGIPSALDAIVSRCLSFHPADRYPSAAALAEDLEAFLSRNPLRYATNPSRTERAGNWLHRNRHRLAVSVMSLALFSVVAYPSIARWLRPDPETLQAFKQMVSAIDSHQGSEAIKPAMELTRQYPDHPLPPLYLSFAFAFANLLQEDPSVQFFLQAMEIPGAEERIRDWAATNTRFADHLEEFASLRLDRVKQYMTQLSSGRSSTQDSVLDEATRAGLIPYYRSMLSAARIALEQRPESRRLRARIASAEDFFGNFASAYEHLTKLVAETRNQASFSDRLELVNLHNQRSRVAIRWAKSLWTAGDPSSQSSALRLLSETFQEMESLAPTVAALDSSPSTGLGRIEVIYYHLYIKTEAITTLAEMQLESEDRSACREAFVSASRSLNRLLSFARRNDIALPQDGRPLENRVRTGLDRLTQS